MFMSKPVRIPNRPGKIVLRKKGENTYVMLETGRKYDPERQFTHVERKMIGLQIPEKPEYMMPNENYRELFPEKDASEDPALESYAREMDRKERARAYMENGCEPVLCQKGAIKKQPGEGKLSIRRLTEEGPQLVQGIRDIRIHILHGGFPAKEGHLAFGIMAGSETDGIGGGIQGAFPFQERDHFLVAQAGHALGILGDAFLQEGKDLMGQAGGDHAIHPEIDAPVKLLPGKAGADHAPGEGRRLLAIRLL